MIQENPLLSGPQPQGPDECLVFYVPVARATLYRRNNRQYLDVVGLDRDEPIGSAAVSEFWWSLAAERFALGIAPGRQLMASAAGAIAEVTPKA